MMIYIDRRRDGKIAVRVMYVDGDKVTVFTDQAEAERFARQKRGKTCALLRSSLEPLEDEPLRSPKDADPKDRVKIWVAPAVVAGPKTDAYASYRVMRVSNGETREIANWIAPAADPQACERALRHARQFAKDTIEQIEWEALYY